MKINEEYNLTSDSLNWILQKRFEKKKKEGEEDSPTEYGWRDIAYFPDYHMALRNIVDREIRGTGITDFETVIKKIDELKETINKLKL